MQVITKAADVTKLIVSIKSRGAKLDSDIHRAGVSCLHHAAEHGDVTLMQKLIDALPKSARRNAVIAWAVEFGAFEADEKGKNVVYSRESKTRLDDAIKTAPWEFKPEPAFKPFDFEKELSRLLKRAEDAVAANDERHKVTAEQVRKLQRVNSVVA